MIDACASSLSMVEAAAKCGISYKTFRKYAKQLGVWIPNQSGRNITKQKADGCDKYALTDILAGKHPSYGSSKLRVRLIDAGIKTDTCEICGQGSMWNGMKLSLQLDHIDGNPRNHVLENLRILCPNCHTQTDTFGRKIRPRGV